MFKNILIYTLPEDFKMFDIIDNQSLEKRRSKPLTGDCISKLGWAETLNDGALFFQCEQDYVFKIERRFKRIANSTLKAAIAQKQAELSAEEPTRWGPQAKITKESRKALEASIFKILASKALTQFSTSYVLYSPTLHMLLVESTTDAYAEDVVDLLRDTFGSVKAKPLSCKKTPTESFKLWLTDESNVPEDFELIDGGLVMASSHKKGNRVTYNSQVMNSDEISANLLANKKPLKLDLSWKHTLSFTLDEHLRISKIQLTKSLRDRIKSAYEMVSKGKSVTLAEAMDKERAKKTSTITLTRQALVKMIPDLLKGLGDYSDTHTRVSSQTECSEPVAGLAIEKFQDS